MPKSLSTPRRAAGSPLTHSCCTPHGAAYDDPVTLAVDVRGFGQITFVVFGAPWPSHTRGGDSDLPSHPGVTTGRGMTNLPSDNRSALRSSSVMAAGTITSRITGLLKNSALLAAVGGGVFADTYSVANTLPTVVYVLLVGGAINAVFIPQLVRHMDADGRPGTGLRPTTLQRRGARPCRDHRHRRHRGAVAGAALLRRGGAATTSRSPPLSPGC